MIGKVIDALNAVSPTVGQRYGLCEKRGDVVFQYVGGGNGQQVNVDQNGTWSYFRVNGKIRKTKDDTLKGCEGWRHSIPLRFVLATRRDGDICDLSTRIIKAVNDFPTAKRAIGTATGALNVIMPSAMIEVDTTEAFRAELSKTDPPLELVLQYADLTIDLLTERECLKYC